MDWCLNFFCFYKQLNILSYIDHETKKTKGFKKNVQCNSGVFQLLSGPAPYLFTCVHLQRRILPLAAAMLAMATKMTSRQPMTYCIITLPSTHSCMQ